MQPTGDRLKAPTGQPLHIYSIGCTFIGRPAAFYVQSPQAVDDYFRTFSGQTQVNATDLRHLRYPSRAALESGRF